MTAAHEARNRQAHHRERAEKHSPCRGLLHVLPEPRGTTSSRDALPVASLLLCVLVLQAGCMLPIPTQEHKVLAGKPVSEEQLAFLDPGVTTQREVVDRLGQPDAIWDEARLYTYHWAMRQGILLWAVGGGYSGAAGMTDLPRNYLLLIQFDEDDRVQRFERAVRPALEPYGEFLEKWVAGSGTEPPERPDPPRD